MQPVRFEIGDYKVTILPVGQFALDGGAMFGVVPKTIWEKIICCDAHNRIPLVMNCVLVEHGEHKVLLDTGIGTKFTPKYVDIYGIENPQPIQHYLQPLGLNTSDITHVCFTHLHFDHAGGATTFNADGDAIPTFEKAQYFIHEGEWFDAHQPTPKSKASYLKENFGPLADSGRLTLLKGKQNEIIQGLSMCLSGGHTASHQIMTLDTEQGGFVYWGDLIPLHHYLKLPYVMAYDLYPVETMAQKQYWLPKVHEHRWLNIFEHDASVPACYLAYDAERHTYSPAPEGLPLANKALV